MRSSASDQSEASRKGPWTEQELVAATVGIPDPGLWRRLVSRVPGPWR